MKEQRNHIIFIVLLLILFLPLLQHKMHLIPVQPLTGADDQIVVPNWSMDGWISGDFQHGYESAIEDGIGFRSWIIRLKNQTEFYLFHKANAAGVIVGKKGYLYESDYIRSYKGLDCLGDWFWKEKFSRFAKVRDTLNNLGIELALVLEPGKASYYPEYIRGLDARDIVKPTNYNLIRFYSKQQGIPSLDLNAWFVSQKDKCEYPLFPKGGIHWSNFGMTKAADTLLEFANGLTEKEIPCLSISTIEETKDLRDTDSDLADILNLIWIPPHPSMGYPEFNIPILPDSVKPRVLTISDSFFFNILNAGIPKMAFANEAFWYYSNAIYPDTWSAKRDTS
ncbi:MAG: hypothetical protein J7L96_05535, partial [Bacteroidales bacterium]|nr:hypothetical protein [Bacteroidales bacterium]